MTICDCRDCVKARVLMHWTLVADRALSPALRADAEALLAEWARVFADDADPDDVTDAFKAAVVRCVRWSHDNRSTFKWAAGYVATSGDCDGEPIADDATAVA